MADKVSENIVIVAIDGTEFECSEEIASSPILKIIPGQRKELIFSKEALSIYLQYEKTNKRGDRFFGYKYNINPHLARELCYLGNFLSSDVSKVGEQALTVTPMSV